MRKQSSLQILAVCVSVLLVVFVVQNRMGHEMRMESSVTPLEAKFQQLSAQGNAFCTDADGIAQMGDRLQGSCCSTMSLH
ncbi:MAG: hypothetical protein HY366_01980, partial [Candidatus Aenigmarchaeota archaeon]|nr:hypothetical protein [Candidatus Aenigmarchaeota archaeon]